MRAFTGTVATARLSFVFLLFFLSGAAGLVYEISWSRQIGLLAGNTATAVALVLAAYFSGLAAGQMLGTGQVFRRRPLLAYGIAELVAAAWACLIPTLLDRIGALAAGRDVAAFTRDSLQYVLCFAALFPATATLGATLPFMAEYLSRGTERGGRRVAGAYAFNTAGGLAGVLFATPFLAMVGVQTSGYLAAAVAAVCGCAACGLATACREPVRPGSPFAPRQPRRASGMSGRQPPWLALAALSGFGTLGLEVLYTRMFALVFHNSTYTFGAVLAVFLAGLVLGAAIVSWFGRRVRPRALATIGCAAGSVAVSASVIWFVRRTGLEYFAAGDTFAEYLAGVFGLAAVVALTPITLLGMVLPSALLTAGSGPDAGRLVAANTIASAAGALTAGFVALPQLGLWGAFGAVSLLFGLAGTVLMIPRHPALAGALASTVVAGVALVAASPRQSLTWTTERGESIVRRWESDYGWIDVVRSTKDGSLKVRQNLHYRHGSTGANAVREYRQGHLPLLLHPRPADVAFLGMGTGVTAAPVVHDSAVEHAVIVELIPEVVEAARLLQDANLGVVDHPKTDVRIDDARHFLFGTTRQFDVIVSDLFVPWESRTGYLYTVEHFETVRRRLKPGGLFCQWVALYQVGPEEFELIADSFAAVFPQTTLWWGQLEPRYGIVALIGSEQPLVADPAHLDQRLKVSGNLGPGQRDSLLDAPGDMQSLFIGHWPARPAQRLNTDEHPWVEFTAPVSHRAGRTLKGPVLRSYFDRVLVELPTGGVRFAATPQSEVDESDRRRKMQRFILFGDTQR